MAKKLTTEQAKTKLREIYGNDYDYSEDIYNDFYYKSKEDFIKQQNRDQVVRDFCKDNNIELIEISYKDENKLEEILT